MVESKVMKGWKEIANYLQVTTRTLATWKANGIHIPVWQIGHEVMIFEEELIRWMKKQKKVKK